MDDNSFELLRRTVEGECRSLADVIASLSKEQRGSTFLEFVRRHLVAVEQLAAVTAEQFKNGPAEAKPIHGRKLSRVHSLLGVLHYELFEYRDDVGRQDLPTGLLYLVDYLIETLLKASADPVIHLDGVYMYSTERLLDRWGKLSTDLGVVWVEATEPVIFNLPGLDASNAFLAPVLAHEVGHSVIQRHDLVSDLGQRLDPVAVSALTDAYLLADPSGDVDDLLEQFGLWAEELLCDALATELTGPAFAFSVAVFFPASSAGQSGPEHPDPAQRFELALRQLTDSGWAGHLQNTCPTILAWLDSVAHTAPLLASVSPREECLRKLVDLAQEKVIEVAREYVGASLDWSTFSPIAHAVAELVEAGVPPAELAGKPVAPWEIIASIWLYGIKQHGDKADALAVVVQDRELSRFALKTVEMSRVLQLWKDIGAPTA